MQRIKKTYCSKTIHHIKKFFHTEKYKLNLIEPSDPFLPDGLNANTQKIEDAMAAHEEKLDGQAADLDARVAVLEGRRFVSGIVTGDGTMHLGFDPLVVLVHQAGTSESHMIVQGSKSSGLTLIEGGFRSGAGFHFMAFG